MSMRLLDTKEGECDDRPIPAFSPCYLEEGWSYLYRAIQLWNLVDPNRGAELKRLLKEEVEHDDFDEPIIVTPALATRIVALLAPLPDALLAITDRHQRLRPEKVSEVLEKASYLVDSWQEASGTVYTLANHLDDVYRVRKFLDRAIDLGRNVKLE
jgi:hypothetical protein